MRHSGRTIMILSIALLLGLCGWAQASEGVSADYTVKIWVEKPDIPTFPGDPAKAPEDIDNFVLLREETKTGVVGETITGDATIAGTYLSTKHGRRYASFLSSDSALIKADGSSVVNVYYDRGVFTYVFTIGYDQAQMTIDNKTYTGNGEEKYTIQAKYEQNIIFPGLSNGLIPVNTNTWMPNASFIAWEVDSRTGEKTTITSTDKITESMLPTEDMLYEGLVFEMTGVWFESKQVSKIACWYEQLPEDVGADGAQEMVYQGTKYVNYPATDSEMILPDGVSPKAGEVEGLRYVTTLEPEKTENGEQGTWKLLFDRERYTLTFDTHGMDKIESQSGVMFQQNLGSFDLGWNEETLMEKEGEQYQFLGWFSDKGDFISATLANIWMPPSNMKLHAMWEKVQ